MHKQKLLQFLKTVGRAVSSETVDVTFQRLCEAVNSPRSLTCWILYKYKEYDQLVNLEVDPCNYSNSYSYADDALISKFLSKYPAFKHENLKPRESAMGTFLDAEMICKKTNETFKELDLDPSKWDPVMHRVLRSARRKISFVLREPDLNSISDQFGWGPGANSSATGNHTAIYNKFLAKLDVTSNSLVMGHCCINSTPAWANCQLKTGEFPSLNVSVLREAFEIVRGNEIVFVPKNAKTDRTIAIEPSVNSYLQKGFGGEIRRLLKLRAGIDLNNQSVNQRLAREGSITGRLSTVDLKSASDTISTEVVRFLLPESWFSLLDSCRSKQGYLKEEDRWLNYHKFSSMGNAFTFELESLIFWAIAQAVASEKCELPCVSVFGDDIIINVEAYPLLVEVLSYCGFTVNKTKSFAEGPFRESCGKDYYLGTEVRSIFLKEIPSNVESLFKLANSIRRYSHRRNFNYGCDIRFMDAWSAVYHRIPDAVRFLIPDGVGDTGLIENFDKATPSLQRPHKGAVGWEGYWFKRISRIPVKEKMKEEHGLYTACLRTAGSEEPFLEFYSLRKMTTPKITRGFVQRWTDLGPWV